MGHAGICAGRSAVYASMPNRIALILAASIACVTSGLAACGRPPQVVTIPVPASASASGDAARPAAGMTISGTATLEISPDTADLTMTLSDELPRPVAAVASVRAKQAALVAALRKLGVGDADLKLSHMSLNPEYENYGGRVRGYSAAITVAVTTRQFDKLAPLMEAGADAGATHMASRFRRSDLPELKKKVRDMAIAAARAKAEQMTRALGTGLGRVVSVSEESSSGNGWEPRFQVSNAVEVRNSGAALGGELESLTLDVKVGFELGGQT